MVLPDDDGVRRLLRDLASGAGLASLTPAAGLALGRLVEAGLVVERSDLTTAARAARRVATAAVFAAHGPGATERLASRARCRVDVDAPDPWRTTVAERLGVAGLVVADPAHGLPSATLLVTLGEPRRSRVDALVRDDRTHLLVALLPDRVAARAVRGAGHHRLPALRRRPPRRARPAAWAGPRAARGPRRPAGALRPRARPGAGSRSRCAS